MFTVVTILQNSHTVVSYDCVKWSRLLGLKSSCLRTLQYFYSKSAYKSCPPVHLFRLETPVINSWHLFSSPVQWVFQLGILRQHKTKGAAMGGVYYYYYLLLWKSGGHSKLTL